MEQEKSSRRRSFFFPILLIALGVIFLLKNVGVVTGDIWDTLLNLWPLLLIALGLDSALRQHGLVGAIFLIGVGAVFLLANFGLLAFNAWEMIIRLWPLLLIAIGLDIAIGHRSILWSLVGLLLLLTILVGTLWLYGLSLSLQSGYLSATQSIRQSLQGAKSAQIEMQLPLGSLRFKSLSDGNDLLSGTIYRARDEEFRTDYSVSEGVGIYRLSSSGSMFFTLPTRGGERWHWDLAGNPSIPLDLNVDMGLGIVYLDLSNLKVDSLQVDIGIGVTTIALGKSNAFQGKIDGAIGQTTLLVPRGTALRIVADTGITHLQVPEDFQRQDDVYLSPGYEAANKKVTLEVGQAIGVLRILYSEK